MSEQQHMAPKLARKVSDTVDLTDDAVDIAGAPDKANCALDAMISARFVQVIASGLAADEEAASAWAVPQQVRHVDYVGCLPASLHASSVPCAACTYDAAWMLAATRIS